MSVERVLLYAYDAAQWDETVGGACRQADTAFRRQQKAPLGEVTEAMRYGQHCHDIQRRVAALVANGVLDVSPTSARQLDAAAPHHPWCTPADFEHHPLAQTPEGHRFFDAGTVLYEVRNPFGIGATPPLDEAAVVRAPAQTWRPSGVGQTEPPEKLSRSEAQEHLWQGQLERAVAGEDVPLVPSNIVNSVLTEGLRRYVGAGDGPAVDARVLYRDGSEARAFPLRALAIRTEVPTQSRRLRFALLSVRHPEMDTEVDGALLRNRVISRVRRTAETDEVAFQEARSRLAALTADGPVALSVFQTGLEPAVIGFYRAVAYHLRARPGTLAVVPHYYRGRGLYDAGTPWTT